MWFLTKCSFHGLWHVPVCYKHYEQQTDGSLVFCNHYFSFRFHISPITDYHSSGRETNMTILNNEEFLSQLGRMYMDARLGGPKSVYVTMKPYDGRTKPQPKDAEPQLNDFNKCLFRAKLGRKRISTIVSSKEVNKFHLAYVSVLRANLDNLERRKKADTNKAKTSKNLHNIGGKLGSFFGYCTTVYCFYNTFDVAQDPNGDLTNIFAVYSLIYAVFYSVICLF
ncbi:signal recognition particle domain protein [Dictyocaulus viviparus]|uniref:Signal recognition particle 14 kDa protein n=1 Tax=Dictyocaulus viviparus TaxID=29172 RepID=A0A0D8XNY2_DICVI|nr:signal recognition particle domain protein [Dictyocaulus viviparus]